MLYMSNDRKKVFDTEQECCEYEQKIEEMIKNREKWETERKNELNAINEKYEELQEMISKFGERYGVRKEPYFIPICELMDMLCIR